MTFDIIPSAIRYTVSDVEAAAASARAHGDCASSKEGIAGLCGTASDVGEAFARLWAQRAQTGRRSGDYAAGCASAMAAAQAEISAGDEQMRASAAEAGARADAVTPAGRWLG
ncbi:hypothetical protein [Nesterenkonia halobia]